MYVQGLCTLRDTGKAHFWLHTDEFLYAEVALQFTVYKSVCVCVCASKYVKCA